MCSIVFVIRFDLSAAVAHQALKGAAGPREGKEPAAGKPGEGHRGRHAPGTQTAFQQIVTDAAAPYLANHFGPGPRM